MYLNQGSTWRKILQVRIGKIDLCDLIKSCLCKKDIMKFRIPKYYQEILTQYQSKNYRTLEQVTNVQKEILWYNRSIRIEPKTTFIRSLYKKEIKMVDDITRSDYS